MLRTHTCGELSEKNVGEEVTLTGWVSSIRRQGKGIIFVDLRDRYGITQLVVLNKLIENKSLETVTKESVIKVGGIVRKRLKENPKLQTGKIEVLAKNVEVLNASKPLPLSIGEEIESSEETKLKYRYLYLRSKNMVENFVFKHRMVQAMRTFLNKNNFLEVDTPMLGRSTPEGARDYIVPSRLHKGKFYALPQSPQLYKQTLMVAGFDKYYQIAKCLRDEDLRVDRQPEFTQLDLEMSFTTKEDIQSVIEGIVSNAVEEVMGIKLQTPFQKIEYKEAMEKYGCDKPDLRRDKKNPKEFAFVWVTSFPLFEFNENEGKLVSAHHPFTDATPESWNKIDSCKTKEEYLKLQSESFDLVVNGFEIGSGGLRIFNKEKQRKIFRILDMSDEEAKEQFGFLLEAFDYGAPPHGGFAIGLERLLMVLKGKNSIREFIAFPKNKNAEGVLESSPNVVSEKQLKEIHIQLSK